MTHQVLALDMAGNPFGWISTERAACYVATDSVAWSLGETVRVFRAGVSRDTGVVTEISTPAIIAIKGPELPSRAFRSGYEPSISRELLFKRDRHVCAYCGEVFPEKMLTKEHILASSKGGEDTWMNLVTACKPCNGKKGDRSLSETGFELLYVPYVPNKWEHFILRGRNILADQMDYLMAKVPKDSRLRS